MGAEAWKVVREEVHLTGLQSGGKHRRWGGALMIDSGRRGDLPSVFGRCSAPAFGIEAELAEVIYVCFVVQQGAVLGWVFGLDLDS